MSSELLGKPRKRGSLPVLWHDIVEPLAPLASVRTRQVRINFLDYHGSSKRPGAIRVTPDVKLGSCIINRALDLIGVDDLIFGKIGC